VIVRDGIKLIHISAPPSRLNPACSLSSHLTPSDSGQALSAFLKVKSNATRDANARLTRNERGSNERNVCGDGNRSLDEKEDKSVPRCCSKFPLEFAGGIIRYLGTKIIRIRNYAGMARLYNIATRQKIACTRSPLHLPLSSLLLSLSLSLSLCPRAYVGFAI
jgi:hypothetical protein